DLNLATPELITTTQSRFCGAQQLLGIRRVNRGLPAGQLLQVVLAPNVAWVPVGGDDVLQGQPFGLLGEPVDWKARVDDHGLFGCRTRRDAAVYPALEPDLDYPQ